MQKNQRKLQFMMIMLISFVLILIYSVLTPPMSDDLIYGKTVRGAQNIWALFAQEYEQYMTWSGRSVNHIILRFFMYEDSKFLFPVANSMVFILLSLCIYWNIERRKKYDIALFTGIQLALWTTAVSFPQTILWKTGSCNYLWGSTIILGFVTWYRYLMLRNEKNTVLQIFGIFLFGIIAGWCNENTSGGGFLLVAIFTLLWWFQQKKVTKPYCILGGIGMLIGLALMVLAPGNAIKSLAQEESRSGLGALVSRGLKIIGVIQEEFLFYLIIIIVTIIVLRFLQKDWIYLSNQVIFGLVGLATSFVLIATPEPMSRAYFGAGIFLLISVLQGLSDLRTNHVWNQIAVTCILATCAVWFGFIYIENGANLTRILRDYHTREDYILQQVAAGEKEIVVPFLRDDFASIYSDAIAFDISEDPENWVNQAMAGAYGLARVSGVEWDLWEDGL